MTGSGGSRSNSARPWTTRRGLGPHFSPSMAQRCEKAGFEGSYRQSGSARTGRGHEPFRIVNTSTGRRRTSFLNRSEAGPVLGAEFPARTELASKRSTLGLFS